MVKGFESILLKLNNWVSFLKCVSLYGLLLRVKGFEALRQLLIYESLHNNISIFYSNLKLSLMP